MGNCVIDLAIPFFFMIVTFACLGFEIDRLKRRVAKLERDAGLASGRSVLGAGPTGFVDKETS